MPRTQGEVSTSRQSRGSWPLLRKATTTLCLVATKSGLFKFFLPLDLNFRCLPNHSISQSEKSRDNTGRLDGELPPNPPSIQYIKWSMDEVAATKKLQNFTSNSNHFYFKNRLGKYYYMSSILQGKHPTQTTRPSTKKNGQVQTIFKLKVKHFAN